MIDSTAGCQLLSFVDAYFGFHQIPLNPEDQIKTAFIIPYGAYFYRVMCFGLRNAGATYQRCMQKCLHDQIGKNVQVYVDDIVVKTKEKDRKSTRLNSSHITRSRMPSSACERFFEVI